MSDPFAPYTTPSPPSELRTRVLSSAISARREPAPLRFLDALWASRSWWLAWSGAMVLLVALAGISGHGADREPFTAESWVRYRASIAAALGGDEVASTAASGGAPGGAA